MATYGTLKRVKCQRFCLWGVFRVEIMVGLVCQEFWFSASYMRIYGWFSAWGGGEESLEKHLRFGEVWCRLVAR